MSIFPWDTRGNRQYCGESHAYSRKYNRFIDEASACADIKHTLRLYDALTFVRMKRSAD